MSIHYHMAAQSFCIFELEFSWQPLIFIKSCYCASHSQFLEWKLITWKILRVMKIEIFCLNQIITIYNRNFPLSLFSHTNPVLNLLWGFSHGKNNNEYIHYPTFTFTTLKYFRINIFFRIKLIYKLV